MDILVVKEPIDETSLRSLANAWYQTLLKGVADSKRGVIALGGEWHMDANTVLLGDGSMQHDVWGFNIYPDETGDAAIEYISLINIRPLQGNKTMELIDESLRIEIRTLVARLVPQLKL